MTIAIAWNSTRLRISSAALAGDVLARRHGDHAADEDISGRAHGEQEEDRAGAMFMARLLGVREGETKRQLAAPAASPASAGPSTPALAHRGERRREVALGEAAAVLVRRRAGGGDRPARAGRAAPGAGAGSGSRRAGRAPRTTRSRRSPHRRRRRRDDRRPARPCGRGSRRRSRSRLGAELAAVVLGPGRQARPAPAPWPTSSRQPCGVAHGARDRRARPRQVPG